MSYSTFYYYILVEYFLNIILELLLLGVYIYFTYYALNLLHAFLYFILQNYDEYNWNETSHIHFQGELIFFKRFVSFLYLTKLSTHSVMVLPARASEQGNVIGSVRIYVYVIA